LSAEYSHRLFLLGPCRMTDASGKRVEISSKKGAALLAMLAMAPDGERTRPWLQDHLWGSRQQPQAQASLRNELLNLRRQLNRSGPDILVTGGDRVRIALETVAVDARDFLADGRAPDGTPLLAGEFLEGLDLAGEDGFEDWLRDQRAAIEQLRNAARVIPKAEQPFDTVAPPTKAMSVSADRPSLAIVPFATTSNDDRSAILGERLAEAFIDRLSRMRWLPVVNAGPNFPAEANGYDVRDVGRALGVSFVVSGRLGPTSAGHELRLTLTDAKTGRVIWSHLVAIGGADAEFPHEGDVNELVGALSAQIYLAEQSRILAKDVRALSVDELVWRARWHLNRFTRQVAERARALIEDALEREPDNPEVLIQATYARAWSIWTLRRPADEIREVRALAHRALAADPLDARAHMLAGIVETWLLHPERAVPHLDQAIALSPSFSHAHAVLGSARYLNDQPTEAVEALETALRLNVHDEHIFRIVGDLAIAHWMLGDFDAAIDYAGQSIARRPAYWFAHVTRINALVDRGDIDDARAAYCELMRARSHFSPNDIDWLPFVQPLWRDRLKSGIVRSL
jgi:TolB-like protein